MPGQQLVNFASRGLLASISQQFQHQSQKTVLYHSARTARRSFIAHKAPVFASYPSVSGPHARVIVPGHQKRIGQPQLPGHISISPGLVSDAQVALDLAREQACRVSEIQIHQETNQLGLLCSSEATAQLSRILSRGEALLPSIISMSSSD